MWKAIWMGCLSGYGCLGIMVVGLAFDHSRPDEGTPGVGIALVTIATLLGFMVFTSILIGGDPFYTVASSMLASILVALHMRG